jgi:hypothetical protein
VLAIGPSCQADRRDEHSKTNRRNNTGASESITGGEGGIRTPDTRQGMAAFEAARFNRSRTSPHGLAPAKVASTSSLAKAVPCVISARNLERFGAVDTT